MPVVKRVEARKGYVEPVTVYFEDDHSIWIAPNTGGHGGDAGRYVERVILYRESTQVAVFHSPYQHPINYTPFGFVELAPHYTPSAVAAYWQAAYSHLSNEQRAGRHQTAWEIVSASAGAMREVQAGQWHQPTAPRRRR